MNWKHSVWWQITVLISVLSWYFSNEDIFEEIIFSFRCEGWVKWVKSGVRRKVSPSEEWTDGVWALKVGEHLEVAPPCGLGWFPLHMAGFWDRVLQERKMEVAAARSSLQASLPLCYIDQSSYKPISESRGAKLCFVMGGGACL